MPGWSFRLPLPDTSAALRAIEEARRCVGVCEEPPSSNRGPEIDAWNRTAGVPEDWITAGKGYWCASFVTHCWHVAGLTTPAKGAAASCDGWMAWAKQTGRWSSEPVLGAAVLYGKPGDASHIGLVVRLSPAVLSIEGNTTLDGYSRNGELVTLKAVRNARVLGYAHPEVS